MAEPTHTLLVVDDNEENRDMLSRRLQRRGYRVLSAESGEEALDVLQTVSVDLVLLDVMMPGMDGIEVLQRVRQTWDQDEMPVIMATAKDDSEDIVEALDMGANDYVTKPIDFAVVSARVQKELRGLDRARASRSQTASAVADAAAAVESAPLGPGSLLEGRYRLESVVGRGNFGTVYRAHHIELDTAVAVKLLQTQSGAEDADALARFRTEGRAAVRVDHPNAVKVYDFGVTDGGHAYLAMELLTGEPLSKELSRLRSLHPRRAVDILLPVCEMLAVAHEQSLVHRDIKPENIFLQEARVGEVVKVLDFGIAKLAGDRINQQNLTADGYVLGTPAYVAPERLQNRIYDGQSDVYSVGVMAFQMLSGELPFKPNKDDPVALLLMHVNEAPPKLAPKVPGLPEPLRKWVMSCLAKDPDDRPTAGESADRLRRLLADLPRPEPAEAGADDLRDVLGEGDAPGAQDFGELEGPTHPILTPRRGIFSRWLDRLRRPGS